MPLLSDSMEEGTVLAWLKQVGDDVHTGEALLEIETDKATMVYEAETSGRLVAIVVGEGETVAVGATLATLLGDGEELSTRPEPAAAPAADSAQAPAPARSPEIAPANSSATNGSGDVRIVASPVARRIARAAKIDLQTVAGSGRTGRILKADVLALVTDAPPTQPALGLTPDELPRPRAADAKQTEELTRLQSTIARRMAEAKATAPHFYLETEVDMTAAVQARKELAEHGDGGVVPSINDLIVKAAALALREFPHANGSYREGRFELHGQINVGIAVAAPGALVVPTVFDADRRGLNEIAHESRRLASAVRDGTITPAELARATFTVSNLGMYGIVSFAAIINPPQAAILAVGAVTQQPVVRFGEFATAQLMRLTLSCDHRILYGAEAAAFLARIRWLLERPLSLAL